MSETAPPAPDRVRADDELVAVTGTTEPTEIGAAETGSPQEAASTDLVADETVDPPSAVAQDLAPVDPGTEKVASTEEAASADEPPTASAADRPDGEATPAGGPRPRPVPRPGPAGARPGPRPGARPGHGPRGPAAPAVPAPPVDPAEATRAAGFGRVDPDGTVFVVEADGERAVGQVPGVTAEEAITFYVRRYLDLFAKVGLFEARLAGTELPAKEVDQTLDRLTEELAEPAAVGDLAALRARLDVIRRAAAARRAAADADRARARELALAERTVIVERAEKIAGVEPERQQWRPAGDELRQLLDAWKTAQSSGPRLDRANEEALWKRFSHARTTFDRERRHHFAELEARNTQARSAKEEIVAEAERLVTSTDWGATAGAYRDLMARWKASGRAARSVDDALWARFRAAQDAFFAARDAAAAATDAEFGANLQVKLALLAEAEALLPVKDLAATKSALRSVQARWEAAGKVPRGDLQRVEGRLRAVEQAVRDAESTQWRRTNPETRARAEGLAAQLQATIADLESTLAAATAAGDARRVAETTAALDARRAWLAQAEQAARDSRG